MNTFFSAFSGSIWYSGDIQLLQLRFFFIQSYKSHQQAAAMI